MKVIDATIPDVKIIEPRVFGDDRGFFYESFNQKKFHEAIGQEVNFVQDNHSRSVNGVLRGLHYQKAPHAQGKLVRCISGEVYDVAVDIRRNSSTFGQWVGVYLSAENHRQLWIPEGFAHGFVTISDCAQFLYKTTDYWFKELERSINFCDADIGIDWPIDKRSIRMSEKDAKAGSLAEAIRKGDL